MQNKQTKKAHRTYWPDSISSGIAEILFVNIYIFTKIQRRASSFTWIFVVCFLELFFFTFLENICNSVGCTTHGDNRVLRCSKTKTNNSLVVCGYLIISAHPVAGDCSSYSGPFGLRANKPLAAHDRSFNRYLGPCFAVSLNMPQGSQ